jgi:outer membrane lipoprotein-sorting protein
VNSKSLCSLFAALVGASCVAASAASEAPALAAFDRAFASVNDYTCILHVREVKGTQTQDRVYQYFVMKPHYVKTLILDARRFSILSILIARPNERSGS